MECSMQQKDEFASISDNVHLASGILLALFCKAPLPYKTENVDLIVYYLIWRPYNSDFTFFFFKFEAHSETSTALQTQSPAVMFKAKKKKNVDKPLLEVNVLGTAFINTA